jgi:very-short-patch-repair endonuclease
MEHLRSEIVRLSHPFVMLPAVNWEGDAARLARRQHGLVTRRQLADLGCTAGQLRVRIRVGRWHLVRRGVYAGGWVPPTPEQAVLAVVLSVGPPCVASHGTAARLWGLAVPPPDAIEVLTPPSRRLGLAGVVHHRANVASPADVSVHRRIPVTAPARTLLDCAGRLDDGALARAVDDALRRRLLRLDDLEACLGRAGHAGRRPVAALRRVVAERLPGDASANDWERRVADVLRRAGLPEPVAQFRVEVGGRRRYLDLAYPTERVGIEFDGFAEHGLVRSTFDDDRVRDNALRLAGWLVLHFTSRSTAAEMVDTTARALAARRSA